MRLTRKERYRLVEANPQNRQYKVTMLRKARNRAKRRNIYFDITLDDITIGRESYILDIPFEVGSDNWQNSPSLDRIDNKRGYEKGNVIVVSMMANSIKNQATPSQIKKVGDFYEKLYRKKSIDID